MFVRATSLIESRIESGARIKPASCWPHLLASALSSPHALAPVCLPRSVCVSCMCADCSGEGVPAQQVPGRRRLGHRLEVAEPSITLTSQLVASLTDRPPVLHVCAWWVAGTFRCRRRRCTGTACRRATWCCPGTRSTSSGRSVGLLPSPSASATVVCLTDCRVPALPLACLSCMCGQHVESGGLSSGRSSLRRRHGLHFIKFEHLPPRLRSRWRRQAPQPTPEVLPSVCLCCSRPSLPAWTGGRYLAEYNDLADSQAEGLRAIRADIYAAAHTKAVLREDGEYTSSSKAGGSSHQQQSAQGEGGKAGGPPHLRHQSSSGVPSADKKKEEGGEVRGDGSLRRIG